jgi:hypothetical protein
MVNADLVMAKGSHFLVRFQRKSIAFPSSTSYLDIAVMAVASLNRNGNNGEILS